jgi:hypothetical protein
MMRAMLANVGKTRWCDKSLPTALHAEVMRSLFPRAKFLCLYRHPLDVVMSGLETSPWGFSGFGYLEYVQRSPENFVRALLQHWIDHTSAMLEFERANKRQCLQIQYEALVSQPEWAVRGICRFVGVPFEAEMLQRSLEAVPSLEGPGDEKVIFTSKISSDSIGRGTRVPLGMIPPALLEAVNNLLTQLGYPIIGQDWGSGPSPLRLAIDEFLESNSRDTEGQDCLVCAEIGMPLAQSFAPSACGNRTEMSGRVCNLLVEDARLNCCDKWHVNLATGSIQHAHVPDAPTVVLDRATLKVISSGSLNPSVALSRGDIRFVLGDRETQLEIALCRQVTEALAGKGPGVASAPPAVNAHT